MSIDRLRKLQSDTAEVSAEMAIERGRFDALRDASPTLAVSAFNLFQTPDALADRMVSLVGLLDGTRVLEPSAGLGRIYRAIRRVSDCPVSLVEVAPQCASVLYRETENDRHCTLHQRDFLEWEPDSKFDVILMNPPFKQGTDIRHIDHALTMLAPGGTLVSLCYAGIRQQKRFGDVWEVLPAHTFKSEGTRADVALAILKR